MNSNVFILNISSWKYLKRRIDTSPKVMSQFVYCFLTALSKMEDIGWTNFELKNNANNNVILAANTMSDIARLYAGKGMILRK